MMRSFAVFFILLLASTSLFANTHLNVGIYNNSPKVFMDEKNKPSGFFVDLLDAIAKERQWQLNYVACDWEECLAKLDKGEIDIMPDVAHSKEREKRFNFGYEVVISSWSMVYAPKGHTILSVLDLHHKRVAVLKNSIQYTYLKEQALLFGIEPYFIETLNFRDSIGLLESKKVDVAIINNFYDTSAFAIERTNVFLNPVILKFAFSKMLIDDIKTSIDITLRNYKKDINSPFYEAKKRWLEVAQQQPFPTWIKWAFTGIIVAIIALIGLIAFFKYLLNIKIKEHKNLQNERIKDYEKILLALVRMIEQRDSYTAGHSQRVATYSKMLAENLGYPQTLCEKIYQAGILHDIGKIATPDAILLKPEKLNAIEYKLIKEHVNVGMTILKEVPMFEEMIEIIGSHHERYDGMGYPQGLKAEEIHPLAQIMIVADAFDAMTTNRIYRHKKNIDEALLELQSLSGTQFHPKVVESALKVLKNITVEYEISQLPTSALEEERFVYFYKDRVTYLHNHKYLTTVLLKNAQTYAYANLAIFSLHHFAEYNDTFGWESGDKLLLKIASSLGEYFHEALIFRIHSNDFILLSTAPLHFCEALIDDFRELLEDNITFSIRYFDIKNQKIDSLEALEALMHKH